MVNIQEINAKLSPIATIFNAFGQVYTGIRHQLSRDWLNFIWFPLDRSVAGPASVGTVLHAVRSE